MVRDFRQKMKRRIITILFLLFLIPEVSCRKQTTAFGNRGIDGELSAAVWEGNISQMKILIARGADVNKTCCGRVPSLHAAAYGAHNEVIKYLLTQGAKVDIGGKFNETALMIAASKGHLETVKLLVANGADVNAYDEMVFETPLKCAMKNGHQEIIKYLVSQGAKENIWWHKFLK